MDALHDRLPIAVRIVAGLTVATRDGADNPGGFYRMLARGAEPAEDIRR